MGDARRTQPNASDQTTNRRRLTVHEAALALGISEDAVRMRVKRGTLEAEREAGRLYVLLTPVPTTDLTDRTNELLAELRDRVRSLEDQLGEERRANDENRRLLLAALERIPPQLEAPSEARGSPESGEGGTDQGTDTPGPERGAERSWWQRWFGAGE